jgi:hypothetical protein
MVSRMRGKNISTVEVTNISAHGIWLLTDDKELFMSYEGFPWFKNATIAQVSNVEEPQKGHFYWPDLDVDLTIDIIEHPEKYFRLHHI